MSEALSKHITVSVRDVVTFILRSGDINTGFAGASRMQEGTRLHQQIQRVRKREAKRDGFVYESEVKLSCSFELNGFLFTVDGRADGVLFRGDEQMPVVEEIKSVSADVDTAAERAELDSAHWHWAQAKCYAYFICTEQLLPEIEIKLTYIHVETEEQRELTRAFAATELKAFFDALMLAYYRWAEWEYTHVRERNGSITAGAFPYDGFRTGQRELAAAVYRTIRSGKNLFAEAPTGTGKTISTLFPAVKAMAEGIPNRIFYLTAKTITRQAAENAARLLHAAGYDLLSIVMTAKDKICVLTERLCNPRDCARARGHYDRVNDAVWDVINNERRVNRETIELYAEKHCVCPHELALDVSSWSDIVIGDYNYAFDPNASLKRFFGEGAEKGKLVLLVDETHNLIERAREMFSASMEKNEVMKLRRTVKELSPALYRALGKVNACMLELVKKIPVNKSAYVSHEAPEALLNTLHSFAEVADKWLSRAGDANDLPDFLDFYFNVQNFRRTYESFGPDYALYVDGANGGTVRLMCLDPAALLALVLDKSAAAVFFSATLTPLPYFRRSLGGKESDGLCRLPSPFPLENLCVCIDGRISTRYKDRERSYEAIAARLLDMCRARVGNYFVFFSSYAYLQNVLSCFEALGADVETMIQRQSMTEPEREDFLAAFTQPRATSLLAFAVMGGMFSEGIDLVGEHLIGAAVIGVGLPLVSEERDVVADYYDGAYGAGFEYAYMYPGMNKVMQAAGRVIRTEKDRGVLLLIDDRFLSQRYMELFPSAWQQCRSLRREESLLAVLEAFWGA